MEEWGLEAHSYCDLENAQRFWRPWRELPAQGDTASVPRHAYDKKNIIIRQ